MLLLDGSFITVQHAAHRSGAVVYRVFTFVTIAIQNSWIQRLNRGYAKAFTTEDTELTEFYFLLSPVLSVSSVVKFFSGRRILVCFPVCL